MSGIELEVALGKAREDSKNDASSSDGNNSKHVAYYDDPRYLEQLNQLVNTGLARGMDVLQNADDGSVVRIKYVPSSSKHVWNGEKGRFEMPKISRKRAAGAGDDLLTGESYGDSMDVSDFEDEGYSEQGDDLIREDVNREELVEEV